MVFGKFDEYWGNEAKFQKIVMASINDISDRVNTFLNGEADFLTFVPYAAIDEIAKRDYEIVTVPTLEVQFLIFNGESEFLKENDSRKAIALAIDQEALTQEIGGFAKVVNQFVSNGVFGFNPNIDRVEFDIEKAAKLAEESGLKEKTLKLHLHKGLGQDCSMNP